MELIVKQDAIKRIMSIPDGNWKPERYAKEIEKIPGIPLFKDAISRQYVMEEFSLSEKTRKYGGDGSGYKPILLYEVQDILEDAPDIQPDPELFGNSEQLPTCEDAISRQAAIDAINSHFGFNIEEEYGSAVQEVINGLPSAQPEREKGKWVSNSPVTMKCDQCGAVIKDWDWHRFKFCPVCDADMRGEQE